MRDQTNKLILVCLDRRNLGIFGYFLCSLSRKTNTENASLINKMSIIAPKTVITLRGLDTLGRVFGSIHAPKLPFGSCPPDYYSPMKSNRAFIQNPGNGYL